MKREHPIKPVSMEGASEEVLRLRTEHEAQGYRITNMKETLLNNPVAFQALINGTYSVSRELAKTIPRRSLNFFGYTIAKGNKCLICGNYFKKIVTDAGITNFASYPLQRKNGT